LHHHIKPAIFISPVFLFALFAFFAFVKIFSLNIHRHPTRLLAESTFNLWIPRYKVRGMTLLQPRDDGAPTRGMTVLQPRDDGAPTRGMTLLQPRDGIHIDLKFFAD
jgi:hypothetical protein